MLFGLRQEYNFDKHLFNNGLNCEKLINCDYDKQSQRYKIFRFSNKLKPFRGKGHGSGLAVWPERLSQG